jgi:hypothetical protein
MWSMLIITCVYEAERRLIPNSAAAAATTTTTKFDRSRSIHRGVAFAVHTKKQCQLDLAVT